MICSKTRMAYDNLNERIKSGQTQEEAADNTGIEYTQAGEVSFQ